MTSVAEQFASNLNFSSFAKAEDLKKRLWFTLGALLVFRFGSYIPLPGIDTAVMAEVAKDHAGGILGIFNRFSGGALARMSIFALGVMPYISASIIMQLMTVVSPQLAALKKEGESGQKKIRQYTRYGTVFLATIQGYMMVVGLEHIPSSAGLVVPDPGFFFRIVATITIIGGTLFLMWLGEQITSRGIGNGISLIIFSGIVAGLPGALIATLEMGRTGALSTPVIAIIFIMAIVVIMSIVFMERAQRRLVVQYPKRQVGMKMYAGQSSHLPIKINSAGVIPPIFASALLMMPLTIVSFTAQMENGGGWLSGIAHYLSRGNILYNLIFVSLIVFFAFFYTAIIFNPEETAENLKKNGGFIPGYRPGSTTAKYLDYVLTRLTVVGAAYLSAVCVLPEILASQYSVPFALGGTSLLIVVGVGMDTVSQVQSHLLAHQYEGLIRKSRLRGRKG
ncbi:MAG: preprotein translocase subunit SecY [Pseudomonadota bacterium]